MRESIQHHLNHQGQLIRRPSKPAHKQEALHYIADKIKSGNYSEPQINEMLIQRHTFQDPALLRRELYINKLIDRTIDGKTYTKFN